MAPRFVLSLALMTAAAGAPGCLSQAAAPAATRLPTARPARPPAPVVAEALRRLVPQQGQRAQLTGKAKLLHDPGSLLSDQGGAVISDQGGAVISDQGGAVISNNGGTLVANNGGGLLGKAKRVVLQAPTLGVYALADAQIRLHDAAGRLLVDEAGKPLSATTGPDGSYRLEAVLPPGNLIARIQLWNGGALEAIVAREGAQQVVLELTTASTLGAGYVRGLAKGEQATLDKLPRAENDRLVRELDAVRGWATEAFKHEDATLEAVTARLRARIPAVEQVARDVEALLLGQARLGAGRPATEVPLGGPSALVVSGAGRLLIGEYLSGRMRRLEADGTLATLMDTHQGSVRANLMRLMDAVMAPDGTLYVCSAEAERVFRLAPGQPPVPCFGSGERGRGGVAPPLEMNITPRALALGPDGTLWVGEGESWEKDTGFDPPRLMGLHPDGTVTMHAPDWPGGSLSGMASGPDGSVWMLHRAGDGDVARIYRFKDGAFTALDRPVALDTWADLAVAPDGTLYASSDASGTVSVRSPEGVWSELADLGPGNGLGLLAPGPMCLAPDGTLHVADMGANLVVARSPGEAPRVVAGTRAVFQSGEGNGFAINGPGGLAADGQGRLYIAENGSHTVRAFDGLSLRTVAGSTRGLHGDGADALAARLDGPRGVAWHDGTLWIADANNHRLRRVDPAGRIETVVGGGDEEDVVPGVPRAAKAMALDGIWGLALAPDGAPWWVNSVEHQVLRLDPTTQLVHQVAGPAKTPENLSGLLLSPPNLDPAAILLGSPTGLTFDPQGRCYVSDTSGMVIYRLSPQPEGQVAIEPFAGRPLRELLPQLADFQATGWPDDAGKPAREAVLMLPTGIAFDRGGNLLVCEVGTTHVEAIRTLFKDGLPFDASMLPASPARIRKIAPDGTITTIAGPGGRHFQDPTAVDTLVAPTGVAVLSDGRLAIADTGTNLVHILPAGSY